MKSKNADFKEIKTEVSNEQKKVNKEQIIPQNDLNQIILEKKLVEENKSENKDNQIDEWIILKE